MDEARKGGIKGLKRPLPPLRLVAGLLGERRNLDRAQTDQKMCSAESRPYQLHIIQL